MVINVVYDQFLCVRTLKSCISSIFPIKLQRNEVLTFRGIDSFQTKNKHPIILKDQAKKSTFAIAYKWWL